MNVIRDTPHGSQVVLVVIYPDGRTQEFDMQDVAAAERYYTWLVNSDQEPKPINYRTRPVE